MPSIVDRHLNTPSLSKQERVCFEAMFHLKTPYVLGSKNANALDGAHGTAPLWSTTDCSGFIVRVFREAFGDHRLDLNHMNIAKLRTSPWFRTVSVPAKGDLILWSAHGGIVVDPAHHTFIGAQTSTGVAIASYGSPYWAAQPGRMFRRYWAFFSSSDFTV